MVHPWPSELSQCQNRASKFGARRTKVSAVHQHVSREGLLVNCKTCLAKHVERESRVQLTDIGRMTIYSCCIACGFAATFQPELEYSKFNRSRACHLPLEGQSPEPGSATFWRSSGAKCCNHGRPLHAEQDRGRRTLLPHICVKLEGPQKLISVVLWVALQTNPRSGYPHKNKQPRASMSLGQGSAR